MTTAHPCRTANVDLLLRDLATVAAHLLEVLPAGDSRREHLVTTSAMAAKWRADEDDLGEMLRAFGEAAGRIYDALPEGDHRRDAFGACARLRGEPVATAEHHPPRRRTKSRRASERRLSVVPSPRDDHTST
jgi:hypothetical protein